MASIRNALHHVLLWFCVVVFVASNTSTAHNHHHHHNHHDHHHNHNQQQHDEELPHRNKYYHKHHLTSSLTVNVSEGRLIPPHFFGIFFEEINHAGVGGLWSELVNNKGFEAGGRHSPSMINPWGVVGEDNVISVITELSSCFQTNPVALRMDILCDQTTCPPGGVGVFNPGYWGMNIEEGKSYKVVFYVRSTVSLDAIISFVSQDGAKVLAFRRITANAEKVKNWTRMETTLEASASYSRARLQFTTQQKGTIWLDQVSAMPVTTYKNHGFRIDLMEMLMKLKPKFLRFPGGCYVEGNYVRNAFRWKETVGPWEQRPGHFGDVWNYWSDDALGFLEYLQLAEDLGAEPVWVVHSGLGIKEQINKDAVAPFVQEMLDGIEFARGSPNSTWGSLRAKLGHPEPFNLKYIAIGNEACQIKGYYGYKGVYMKFYKALKKAYPDIKAISNCDASDKPLDHPADLYDFHRYTNAHDMLQLTEVFTKKRRDLHAAKAFVSEYAVTYPEDQVGNGTFGGALAEAAFLLSLEQNSDIVEMFSYAPLFVNTNDRTWNPDAIFLDTSRAYGISSYWVQTFFKESSGARLLHVHFNNESQPNSTYVSAISWVNEEEKKNYITIKVVNYNNETSVLKLSLDGVDTNYIKAKGQTVLTCDDLEADNSFDNPTKVIPVAKSFKGEVVGGEIDLVVEPYSFTAFDFANEKPPLPVPAPMASNFRNSSKDGNGSPLNIP